MYHKLLVGKNDGLLNKFSAAASVVSMGEDHRQANDILYCEIEYFPQNRIRFEVKVYGTIGFR